MGTVPFFLVAGLFLLLCCGPARAETPLYEEEPYDQITLDSANGDAVLKIRPLDLPNRQPPAHLKTVGKLIVRRVEEPDKEYEVAWRNIVKLELFEQLVLDKANELTADGKYDEAYDYFTFLERNKPNTPGLGQAMEDYLYEEAKDAHRRRQYDSALALLREAYRRDPRRPGLEHALGLTTDRLVDQYVSAANYGVARALLRNLAAAYPESPVVRQWHDRLVGQAAPLLGQARAEIEADHWDKAAELSLRLTALWPDLPGARELALTIFRKNARVEVGVGSFPADIAPGRLDDWAARRTGRLLYRTLTEFAGSSSEGGKYVCPVGEIATESLGRRLKIRLKPNIHWAQGNATLGNSDVAWRLLTMADPNAPGYRIDWADLMATVSIEGVYGIDVELRRPHVRPEAMLQVVLTPHAAPLRPGELPPTNGPFVVQSRSPQETAFTANGQYFAAEAGAPKELVERRYATVAQAAAALKRGEIQVLDRVTPWLLPSLRATPHLRVQSYALPLIHCLVPNLRRPLPADPIFRRALAYGIHRQVILDQMLGGAEIPGCVVTSSPFPVGLGPDDPMSYASDENIEPRSYEPRLAIALAHVAIKNYLDAQKGAAKEVKASPKLVLACPPDEVARAACASIQKQLKLVGIPSEVRVLEGPLPVRIPDDVDLLYAELAMWEPLVDARRVLGEDGIAGGCSPYMTLALRQLDEAVEWDQVRECLHRVHRIAHDDVAIVPLWQLVEHFAYHDSLQGISSRPVSLYQYIEQWRPAFRYPTEK
jgi:ABC-type transport system substrate-binding protein